MQGYRCVDIALLYVWVYAVLAFMQLIAYVGLLIIEPAAMTTGLLTDMHDSEAGSVENTTRNTNDAGENSGFSQGSTEGHVQFDCSSVQGFANGAQTR